MSMKNVWIFWRLDGDFMTTQVVPNDIPKFVQDAPDKASMDTWIKIAIKAEHSGDHSDEEINELILSATETTHPNYVGYEILSIFTCDNINWIY